MDAIIPFLHTWTTEDAFHDMIVCYYETRMNGVKDLISRTRKMITEQIKEQNRITFTLYNPYRNISLNQALGNSSTAVSGWMDFSGWREWLD